MSSRPSRSTAANTVPKPGRSGGDAGGAADVGKGAVPVVAKELVRHLREDGRRALVAYLVLGLLARLVMIDVHFNIVADVQIQIAVPVDVAPGAAGGEVRV